MVFKLTADILWHNAIECWEEGNPKPMALMLMQDKTRPKFATEFLQQIVKGTAPRKRGRPRRYQVARTLLINMEFGQRNRDQTAQEAIDALAEKYKMSPEAVRKVVYPPRPKRGKEIG